MYQLLKCTEETSLINLPYSSIASYPEIEKVSERVIYEVYVMYIDKI